MVRAYDDRTSTCSTCTYWQHAPKWDGAGPARQGYCGWSSVPAWVHKHLVCRDDTRLMYETEGKDCWQHTKRPPIDQFMKELERDREPHPAPSGGDERG